MVLFPIWPLGGAAAVLFALIIGVGALVCVFRAFVRHLKRWRRGR